MAVGRTWVCVVVLMLAGRAWGAAPDVTSLFPAGGQQGTTVSVTIQGKVGDGAVRVWSSNAGVSVTLPEKPGPVSVTIAPQADPGVSWLRFYNDEGASALRPFIVGACHEITEVEPNDDVGKAQPLPELPVVVNGQHGKGGDADSFAVFLRKGQVLVATMLANRVLGSPQDAVLQILSPRGFVLEQNEDDHGFDPQIAFTVPADGIYTLRTWAFPAAPDSSIRLFGSPACVYRLLVTTGPFVDHTLPASVEAGAPVQVHLKGWNVPETPLTLQPPTSALGNRFTWPLAGWSGRLPTTVTVQPHAVIVEQEPNDLARAQHATIPFGATGRIGEPRDFDAYRFAARKGQKLRFDVIARDADSPLDPVLSLYDSAGKLLKEADDDGKQSADPDIEFAIPADGDYRAAITDRFLHGGERFVYTLNVTDAQPDFTLSVAADVLVLRPDAELETAVTVTRTSGFAEEIRLSASGLPTGVSVEYVPSESKGDSAKTAKLKLKSDGQSAFSGPLQIVGIPGGSATRAKNVTFGQKAFQFDSPHLWLTVLKKP